jgi:hypothetical protein
MKLTRLRPQPDRFPNCLPVVEVERDFLFASTMLVHIERLPEVRVLSKKSWAMSDSFEAIFAYKGYRFYMGIPFGCIMIAAQDADTPGELLNEIAAHIDRYRTVWPVQLLWAMERYFFLPFGRETRHTA